MEIERKTGRYQWQAIILCFLLAALTGFLYRLGMLTPLPEKISLQNIRHAHSHLMFFCWAGALPLYLMYRQMCSTVGIDQRGISLMRRSIWGMILFGLLSYPFFLRYGYHPVPLGGSSLPLSVILSGLVMICWYLYLGGYLVTRKNIKQEERNTWFEAALIMLFVSSLGAWGVAVTQALDVSNPLMGKGLTHFFLACFTEGWVVLGTVAILDELTDLSEIQYPVSKSTLAAMILLGAPLTFPYGISESLLTPVMLNTARVGGLVAGVTLTIIAYSMLRTGKIKRSILIWPIGLLLLKGVMQGLASVIPSGFWLSDHALRVFYLHVLLLGGFSLAGIGIMHRIRGLGQRSFLGVTLSVLLVLASLLLLTRFWPVAWSGMWVYYVVAGIALLPVAAVGAEWWKLRTDNYGK